MITAPLLTARVVAELLGVHTETVLRWYRRGDLPAIQMPGGAIRFRSDELETWITGRATPGRGSLSTVPSERRPSVTVSVVNRLEGNEE
jgi:excisionase family DNA binding protein